MLPRETNRGRDGAILPSTRDRPVQAGAISDFVSHQFRHFTAGALRDAAEAYVTFINGGGQMMLAMAGAMSTGEVGITISELIRAKKIHAISCTGANLEESLFLLTAGNEYISIPDYRDKTPADDQRLGEQGLNRVTDVAIPSEGGMSIVEDAVTALWKAADAKGESHPPHEYLYDVIRSGHLKSHYVSDERDCWLVAAAEANLPLYVPGWEDSTLGNVYAALLLKNELQHVDTVSGGIAYMLDLARWYTKTSADGHAMGFTQIGGGIAGDFAICVVPMLKLDYGRKTTRLWEYLCCISDGFESWGGYSAASLSEKASWIKRKADSPAFMLQSDATVIFPLLAAFVLGW